MSSKRQATSNLNHDNWDQEEEPEERGTFKTAPPEELKARVIKKATRRTAGGNAGGSEADEKASPSTSNSSVFSGFSGFGKAAASSSAGSPFAFISKLTAPDAATTKPSVNFKADDKLTTTPAKKIAKTEVTSKPVASIFGNASATDPVKSIFKPDVTVEKFSNEYCESVAALNTEVMKFLKEQMDKRPYCILTPVFESYDVNLKELQQKEAARKSATSTSTSTFKMSHMPTTTVATPTPASVATTSSFSFGKPNTAIGSGSIGSVFSLANKDTPITDSPIKNKPSTSGFTGFGKAATETKSTASTGFSFTSPTTTFSFGGNAKPSTADEPAATIGKSSIFSTTTTDSTTPKTNGFSFGNKSEDKPSTSGFTGFGETKSTAASSGFSFASPSTTFSFGNCKPPTAATIEAAAAAEEEEDTPPVVEFSKVVEEDATFSKRCKVFVKKDKDYADRGVGTLYLKPVKGSDKTQMLVRADTNLGNILINLILSKVMPCKRMGKNNVLLGCIPTPEETQATSVLIRVKSEEEADELLEQIKTHSV